MGERLTCAGCGKVWEFTTETDCWEHEGKPLTETVVTKEVTYCKCSCGRVVAIEVANEDGLAFYTERNDLRL